MNRKAAIAIIAGAIVILGSFGGYKVQAYYTEQSHIRDATLAINHLFSDKSHNILANSVNITLLKKDQKMIEIINDKNQKLKLNRDLNKAKSLLQGEEMAKKEVNELFQNGILASQVTVGQIDEAEKLVTALTDPKLQGNLQSKLDMAKTQLTAQTNAEKAVLSLFADGTHQTLAKNINRDSYNKAKNLVNGIQNQSAKKILNDLLYSADSLLTKAEKAQNEAKQAQLKAVEAAGVASQSSTGKSTSIVSSGRRNTFVSAQTGFAGIIAKSKTAQRTDQIVTVVASGTYATVELWEKANNQWGEVFSTDGRVGSDGVGHASEGSSTTPMGAYTLGFAFGKANPGTQLPFRQITPNSYWISDVNSKLYNTWQEGNYPGHGNEHLADYENLQYYYAIVINYNTNAVSGAGSGFFLHISNGQATAGCVAVPKSYMYQFMKRIHPGAYIINVNSEDEVANY